MLTRFAIKMKASYSVKIKDTPNFFIITLN